MLTYRSFAVGLLLAGLAFAAGSQDDPVLVGAVTKVTDGDTIEVQLSSGPITVRFDSIDAPERDQSWGKEATQALQRRIAGEEVALEVVSQDQYDRLVAVVYLGDENINAWMVQQGHAWAYRQYVEDMDYCAWEGAARSAELGLWGSPPEEWYSPWEWRSAMRGDIEFVTDYANETVANCMAAMRQTASATRSAPTPTKPPAPAATGNCLIKGNISDNGHIYHVPGSRSYDATKIDESKGERWFCTEEEARSAGWRAPRG